MITFSSKYLNLTKSQSLQLFQNGKEEESPKSTKTKSKLYKHVLNNCIKFYLHFFILIKEI